jgi:hypothetical protein
VAASGAAMWHDDVNSHHADVILPCQLLSHADVSSTDDDVAPVDLPCLTTTLTVNIFQSVTLFDESFVSLEILRCALHDHAIFTEFWEL